MEILEAILKAALPLGALSYLLFRWSYKAGRLDASADRKTHRAAVRTMRKNRKAKTKNPIHNKWAKFGGGFYGLVALWTFMIIEAIELYQFAQGYEGVGKTFEKLSNASAFDLAINFLINSAKNFAAAAGWPFYWMSNIVTQNIWVWLVAAYAGYWAGMKAARTRAAPDQAG